MRVQIEQVKFKTRISVETQIFLHCVDQGAKFFKKFKPFFILNGHGSRQKIILDAVRIQPFLINLKPETELKNNFFCGFQSKFSDFSLILVRLLRIFIVFGLQRAWFESHCTSMYTFLKEHDKLYCNSKAELRKKFFGDFMAKSSKKSRFGHLFKGS